MGNPEIGLQHLVGIGWGVNPRSTLTALFIRYTVHACLSLVLKHPIRNLIIIAFLSHKNVQSQFCLRRSVKSAHTHANPVVKIRIEEKR